MFSEILDANDVTAVLILGAVLLYWYAIRKPSGLPPGPPVLIPGLGNFLLPIGGDLKMTLRQLRKKYGDVFSFYKGAKLNIVISGYDTMKEAFVKNGDVFSDRPHTFFTTVGKGKQLGIARTSGQVWKEQRKFALQALREFGVGKTSFHSNIKEEVIVFLDAISKYNGASFDISYLVRTSVSNVICSVAFGQRFDHDDADFMYYLDRLAEHLKNFRLTSIADSYSFLRHLPGDPFKIRHILSNFKELERFHRRLLKRHKDEFDENNIKDFTDAYIKEMSRQENQEVTTFQEEQLLMVLQELFGAGTDTTATTLHWAILYLMTYPDVQDRMRAEIHAVVGKSRLPSMEDRPSLPFIEATIMEVQRRGNILPLAPPHAVARDIVFRGFRIPREAVILPDLDSVMMDSDIFKGPNDFRPTRFLNKDGTLHKPEQFIPFSLGRRKCLGASLAKMELFLFLSAMVQRFEFIPGDGDAPPSLHGVMGITYSPKPFVFRAVSVV